MTGDTHEGQGNGNGNGGGTGMEAPASATVKFVTPDGFEVLFTARDASAHTLLTKRLPAMLKALHDLGAVPAPSYGGGKGKAKVEPEVKTCPIHGEPMRRHEKNGKTWYSHKDEDGEWCNGKGGDA